MSKYYKKIRSNVFFDKEEEDEKNENLNTVRKLLNQTTDASKQISKIRKITIKDKKEKKIPINTLILLKTIK